MKQKIDSWKTCSINDYYRILDVLEDNTLCEVEKNVALLAIVYGVEEETIWSLNISDLKGYMPALLFMEQPFEYDQNFNKTKLILNGTEYAINPNLQDFNVAQYFDFQSFYQKNDLRKHYGNLLACFIIPKGKKYNEGYDVLALADEFRDTISIVQANEILGFFMRSWQTSIKVSVWYSKHLLKKMKKMNKKKAEIIAAKVENLQHMVGLL